MTSRRPVFALILLSILCWPLLCAAAGKGANTGSSPARQDLPLDTGWQFRQVVAGGGVQEAAWKPATVPGDVHLDLLANKMIPEPFFRDNEAKLQWIENADWEYRTTIHATPELLRRQHVELVFDGLDAYALVSLNGAPLLTADNMFRSWRVDIKPGLRPGDNELRVVFPSPIRQAALIAVNDPWRTQTQVEPKTYIRKAAYEYGWDWGPRFVTSGIWRPARIESWDDARIANVYMHQQDVNAALAHLNAEVTIEAGKDETATISVETMQGSKRIESARTLALRAGMNHLDLPLDIDHPQLWYPAGYGPQPIYTFTVHVTVGGAPQDETTARTGLRSIVLRRELDQWGRSFEFVVNGIPVFAKGADVIPFDSFPSRVTTEQYRRILQSARDSNMNMIRHWGGGYYETDEFYNICDELGIMVWQDFMFGNDWQPGTYKFKQDVAAEAQYQLERLRNHPSIVLWCGNNETESAFNWKDRDKLPADARLHMWQDYLTVFSGVLANAVARFSPETPYWPSSPSADYEEQSDTFKSGDMHDWSVWHGRVPFEEYEKHFPRFMTEYGFQSFPEMRTVEAFTIPEDRTSIFTPVMLAHQKNNEGNSLIHDYMLKYYTEPKDFASLLYASQVLQAEGIKIGAEHLRRTRPRAMGSIYWQLNDCWPVASWSSIDYYGRWKALQYYARRFYNPVLVSPHMENGALAVYVISDKTAPFDADLRVRILTFDGQSVFEKTQRVHVDPLSSKIFFQLPMSEAMNFQGRDTAQLFASAELTAGGSPLSSNLIYLVPTKQVHLPAAAVQATLTQQGGSYRLQLSSPVLARSTYVSFGNLDVKLSDNFVNLLPGEPVVLQIESPSKLPELQSNMKVVSLVDAFQPAGTAEAAPPATP